MLGTTIIQSSDLMANANATNSGSVSTAWTAPNFIDNGAVHLYTINWHPSYLEILCDGVRIQFQAFNQYVPSEWLKLTFIARPILDPTNLNTDDSTFWINGVSYNSDVTRLKSIVSNG